MKIKSTEKSRLFIPEFNGNKELPVEEQITVHIKRFPPASTLNAFKKFSFSGDNKISIDYPADTTLIQSYVGKIDNLELEDKDKVYDGPSLAKSTNTMLKDLIAEIRDYLIREEDPLTVGEN